MTKPKQLTRTCSACGEEKPLSAFLQVGGAQGTHYGAICTPCRIAGKTTAPDEKHNEEEGTTIRSGERIGIKEKVYATREQRRQREDTKQLFIKDSKKRDEFRDDLQKDIDRKQKIEKAQRKIFIDEKQKRGFLNQSKIPERAGKSTERIAPPLTREQDNLAETLKIEDIIRQEFQITSLDFSAPFIANQTTQVKFYSDTFLRFKSWIGASSPIVRTLERLYGKQNPSTTPSSHDKPEKTAKESLENYINSRTETPSSSRRR